MAGNTREETLRFQFEAKQQGIDEVNKALEESKEKSDESSTAFGFFQKHLEEIISLAAAVSLALKGIDFGKESLKNAEDVEVSLARVRALAGDAANAFGDMDEAVEKAAQSVNVTTQESASGLAALVGAGLNAKDAITALIPTLQLAKIANIDVGTAAQEVARQLSAFNLPASDAQKVVDQLTAASHGAAGGLGAMSNAAVTLAPDAAALGLQFTDVVSILGVLNSKGSDTEKSVRSLRGVFQDLQDPTSKLRGELLALGDGTGDFGKAITALSANTPRAHDALLTLSGPSRTLVELLGQAGPDAIAKFNDSLQQTQGSAAKTADVMDDTLRGAATRFKLAIEDIGEKLAKPVLQPFTEEITKLARELNTFADSPDFKDIETEVGNMARNAAKALDEFIHGIDWKTFTTTGKDAIKGLSDDFSKLAKSAGDIADGVNKTFATVGTAYHGVSGAIDGVVAAASNAADGLVTAAEKVGDLEGAGDALRKNTEGLHAALESLADNALEKMDQHTTVLRDDLKTLGVTQDDVSASTKKTGDAAGEATPKIQAHGDAAAGAAKATGDLKSTLELVPQYLDNTAQHVENTLRGFEGLDATVGKTGDTVRNFGGGPLQDARKALADATQALADLIKQGNATPEALQEAEQAVISASRELDKLSQSGKAAADALKTAFATLKISSQESLQTTADAARNAFETIDKGSAQTAAGLADRQNAFLAYAKAALAASAGLDDGAKSATQYELEATASALGLLDVLQKLEGTGRSAGKSVAEGAQQGAEALKDAAGAAKDAGDNVKDMAGGGGESLAQLDNALANTRAGLLSVSEAAAQAFDKRFYGDFFNAFDGTGLGFTKVINGMAQALADTNAELAADRDQLKGVIDATNQMATSSTDAFGKTGALTDSQIQRLQGMSAAIKDGSYQMGILGQQELAPLQAALDGAIQRAQALKAAAQQASDQLADLNSQLQDERDQQLGDDTSIENRRYQQQVQNINDLASKANDAGKAQAQQDLQLAAQIHAQKLKDIDDQAAAQAKANGGGSGGGSSSSGAAAKPAAGGGGIGSSNAGGNSGGSSTSSIGGDGSFTSNHSFQISLNIPNAASLNALLKNASQQDLENLAGTVAAHAMDHFAQQFITQLQYAKSRA